MTLKPAQSDTDLLNRLAAGDALAMKAFFARHQAKVFRFSMRLLKDNMAAEDLTNEVFMRVWQRADSFRGQAAVSTWLLSIARNMALSRLRKRSEETLGEGQSEALVDDADTPEILAQKASKGEAIKLCIAKLSAEHQEIIDLVYYHEKSVREVGEVVGIPDATVKTRMFYARKQLAELMRDHGIDRGWP
ncbi:MAG: sigma-70 family RNA polymerase sigma factor [Stappiaceae bacterium]